MESGKIHTIRSQLDQIAVTRHAVPLSDYWVEIRRRLFVFAKSRSFGTKQSLWFVETPWQDVSQQHPIGMWNAGSLIARFPLT